MKKKVTILSQGCRLNHAETATIINEFSESGYLDVDLTDNPEIVVINTCTVTENGDKDTIRLVNKINKTTNNAKIALIGCQSQVKKGALLKLNNVEWVIGNDHKLDTVSLILNKKKGVNANKIQKKTFFQQYSSFDPRHTRVNLKIQDGCDFFCSFCIIPFARGPARSRDYDNVLNDAKSLISLGVKEIILTGINLGTYESNGKSFYNLLDALLNINSNIRFRISSIEPTTIDERMIQLWNKYPNLCRYLHLPLQSGTNEILKKMRRKYDLKEFDNYITSISNEISNICIGTDVIVGFPGETDDLFEKTYQFLETAPINYFHVFSYSERSMAHARKFEDKVPINSIKERSKQLRTLSKKKWREFCINQLGRVKTILFESKKNNYWMGTTDDYIKVACKSDENLKNMVLPVCLKTYENEQVYGKIEAL